MTGEPRTVDISTLSLASFVSFAVGAILATVLVGYDLNKSYEALRNSAIDAGAAEWTIDAKTGEREFRWIKPEWTP